MPYSTMGDLVEGIRTFCTVTHADLVSLTSTRMYPGYLPQGATKPALVYSLLSSTREMDFGTEVDSGELGLSRITMQFDCYALTHLATLDLGDVLDEALRTMTTVNGINIQGVERISFTDLTTIDGDRPLYRVAVDYAIHFKDIEA